MAAWDINGSKSLDKLSHSHCFSNDCGQVANFPNGHLFYLAD